jgi:Transposase DDE domain group 1
LVKPEARLETVGVTADGAGLVSHAGVALLVELTDRAGLTAALSEALAGTRERRSAHDPGRVLRDVAVMLADGGDCVTDIDAYRGQQRLFGARASETTTHRVLKAIDEWLLGRVRCARAQARARVWDAGARPDTITLNIDATLLTAHSEKESAAGNYKHGFGFHPLGCWLDETGEALAAILRPGNAGSNTAEDHFQVLGLALAQLPAEDLDREILVRTDIGGQTHAFTADCRDAGIHFSVGYELTETVRRDPQGPGGGVDTGDQRGRGEPGWRVGDGADRPHRSVRLARGVPPGLSQRASAPRRAVHDLRRARLPVHVLSHRPRRQRHRRPGVASPRPRAGRGQHPRRQGHRHAQPPAPQLRAQPDLA